MAGKEGIQILQEQCPLGSVWENTFVLEACQVTSQICTFVMKVFNIFFGTKFMPGCHRKG